MRLATADDRDIDNVDIVASDIFRGDDGLYKLYFSIAQGPPESG